MIFFDAFKIKNDNLLAFLMMAVIIKELLILGIVGLSTIRKKKNTIIPSGNGLVI